MIKINNVTIYTDCYDEDYDFPCYIITNGVKWLNVYSLRDAIVFANCVAAKSFDYLNCLFIK